MKINIDNLTEDELIELNHKIVERLKFLETMHTHNEMMQFNPGEQVAFEPPGRKRQIGTLVKFNKKTVTITTENRQKWNVSPGLISKIKNIKSKTNNTAEIIGIHGNK
ncbi:MAG: hypothetical protein GXP23_10260 [Gammaproteobacteria bacterium]|nr:hypothetical protein [Gammaproteobacteria bacterium]